MRSFTRKLDYYLFHKKKKKKSIGIKKNAISNTKLGDARQIYCVLVTQSNFKCCL